MNRNSRVLLSLGAILLGILSVAVVAHIKHDAAKTPAASNTGKESNGLAATSDETAISKQKSHLMPSINTPSSEAAEDAAQLNKKFEAERKCFDGMRASEIAQP